MVKRLILKARNSIWFIPAFYCVGASILAALAVLGDTVYNEQVHPYIPIFLLTTVDLAQTILGTVSGALLTMTTITFSTIMVVLTTYSSQFSPRSLKNFLVSPSTQRVLGVFMGGFIYSILSLLFMRKQSIEHEVMSASISVILAVVCLAFFAYFIHKVATSIQVSNLIYDLTEDALHAIREEQEFIANHDLETFSEKPELPVNHPETIDIMAPQYGYIQLIDYKKLMKLAREKRVILELHAVVGDFVTEKSKVLTIYHHGEKIELERQIIFTIGAERSAVQDIEFGIEKLMEVALRAVSPGINDPNTAIHCIRYLGKIMLHTASIDGSWLLSRREEGIPEIIFPRRDLNRMFYTAFAQVSFYGRQDVSVLFALFDTLIDLARHGNPRIQSEAEKYGMYIMRRFDTGIVEDLDREILREKQQALRDALET